MIFVINIDNINFKFLCRIVKLASFASVDGELKLTAYHSNYFINLASSFRDLFNSGTDIKFAKFYIFILNLQIKIYNIYFYYSYPIQNIKYYILPRYVFKY